MAAQGAAGGQGADAVVRRTVERVGERSDERYAGTSASRTPDPGGRYARAPDGLSTPPGLFIRLIRFIPICP
ncbi:hypothetical protein GCM10010300_40860 [Streptomyces olivaceoviridis]|nr:hypothetical protein GCM10010300_40860 [Streptomyces olivaceoviridis]